MSFLKFLSKRAKISIVSIAVLAILLASGALTPSGAFSFAKQTSTPGTILPSAAPTFVGTAGNFLSGPFLVSSVFGGSSSAVGHSSAVNDYGDNGDNGKPLLSQNQARPAAAAVSALPTVDCTSQISGCDSVTTDPQHVTTTPGLNAVSSFNNYGDAVQPSDMGLCANNQYVMEVVNVGQVQVYSPNDLTPVSATVSLDNLMGLPSQGASGWSSGGDIQCNYDYGNGGHWFITEFVSTTPEPLGVFSGCFAGTLDSCREGIAVSVTNNPMGAYNVYFLDPNKVNNDPGAGYLLNDFAKQGTTQDAFMLTYDEFNQNPATIPACPAFGCFGFNGAQAFAFEKDSLERGEAASSVKVAYENLGNSANLYPIPANGAFQPAPASCFTGPYAGAVCWYQVIPAQTPDPSQYDNQNGGTGFMVAAIDYFGLGDNRITAFYWTGLSELNGHEHAFNAAGRIQFGGEIFTTPESYMDEGLSCPASLGGVCGIAPQKAGPIPEGDTCTMFGLAFPPVTSCPEYGIATNGDDSTQASYSNGQLWSAISTLITQTFSTGPEIHAGAAYWAIDTDKHGFSIANQGYITPAHEDIEFPSIAATDSGSALMSFTLSGNGGPTGADNGGFYPSTAYIWLAPGSNVVHVAALGMSPYDGTVEYRGYSATTFASRPRWGDYGAAIFVPSGPKGSGHVYFSAGYIQYPNCTDAQFLSGLSGFNYLTQADATTCGGTRTFKANWGSAISSVSVHYYG
jgi:hypothetical protein